MKRLFQLVVLLFVFTSCKKNQEPKFQWKFNPETEKITAENINNIVYPISSNFAEPEFVEAVDGTGIRLDGYSTVISGLLPEKVNKPSSITGWFALETYPTDTAGFFALTGPNSKEWISACVDRFGKPFIGLCLNDQVQYFGADAVLSKFQWIHVCLNINNRKADLMINGKVVKSVRFNNSDFRNGFESITIGRDERVKHLHIFPLTHLNGIVDEVEMWDKPLASSDIKKLEIEKVLSKTPDLSIPESRFKNDFNRPKYHILPAANWTNESHGLIYYKGRYHIFNQKNGTNLYLGQINWGHFSSPDLVQWTEHRPVLTPEPGYDQYGIWSGHAVIDDTGKPAIMYTGGSSKDFGMCLANSVDSTLIEWKKYEGNPLVQGPPKQFSRIDFRDPYLWKEGDIWYMIVGFGLVENEVEKGTVLLYKSTDMKNWEYLHPLFVGDPEKDGSGIFWEMPVFWKMNGKYILSVNPIPYKGKPAIALYWVGDFVNGKFVPDHKMPKKLEVVNRLLSPSVARDKEGRTIAIAIIPDEIHAEAQLRQGWTHLFSIPRTWELKNGEIYQQPHPNLKKLRETKQDFESTILKDNKHLLLSGGTHQLEINVELIPENCKKFGFIVGKNKDSSEFTKIYYDFNKQQNDCGPHTFKSKRIYPVGNPHGGL